jgi:hypothetical protein
MARWLVVENGVVISAGSHSGGVPTAPDGISFVEADAGLIIDYNNACDALRADLRDDEIEIGGICYRVRDIQSVDDGAMMWATLSRVG